MAPAEMRIGLIAGAARMEQVLGRPRAGARRAWRRRWTISPTSQSAAAVAVMIELAREAIFTGSFESMRDWAKRALSAAKSLGDRPLMTSSVGARGTGQRLPRRGARRGGRLRRGGGARGRDDRRRARRAARRGRRPGGRGVLPRPSRRGPRARRARVRGRARDAATAISSWSRTASSGTSGWRKATSPARPSSSTPRSRRRGSPTTPSCSRGAWSTARSWPLRPATWSSPLGIAEESVEAGALHGVATAWSGFAYASALFGAGEPARAEEVLVGDRGRRGAADLPGGVQARGLELLDALPAGGGSARGRPSGRPRPPRACADRTGLPLASAMADRARPPWRSTRATRPPLPTLALSSAAAAEGAGAPIDAALARLFAGRALARAGRGGARGLRARPRSRRRSRRAARRAAATRPSASSAGSGAAGTAARAPAGPARPASSRSRSASCRSRG